MFTQFREPNHHFSAFYEDNSILIQFIVEEFIQSYHLIVQIKSLIQKRLDSNQTLDSLFDSIIPILGQLVGGFSQQERPPFSRWSRGPLTKFKEYCEQFSRNAAHQNKKHVNLHLAAHQTWLKALYNFELLNSLHINPYTPNTKSILFLLSLKRAFHSFQTRFDQISRLLPQVLNEYANNENVILCLFRKKDSLSEIYGRHFLYKRFKYPVKSSELMEFLIKRYQMRGFEALFPTIQHLFESKETTLKEPV